MIADNRLSYQSILNHYQFGSFMKSLLLLPMLLLGCVFTFSSCTKEEITQQVVIPNKTIQFEVKPNAWTYDNTTKTYFAKLPIEEIDDYANQNSGILVYISDDKILWEAIPDVINGSTYIYTYETGNLYLEIQNVDGTTRNPPTKSVFAKVVIVESDPA